MAGPSTQKGETMKTFIQGERANSEYNNDPTDNCLSIPPAASEYLLGTPNKSCLPTFHNHLIRLARQAFSYKFRLWSVR